MLKIRESIENRVRSFDEQIRRASTDKVALALNRDKKRFLCRNDLFFLCGVTGNSKIISQPEIYRGFCDEVSLMNWVIVRAGDNAPSDFMLTEEEVTDNPEDLVRQRLFLCYRAFYKTTIITKVHSLQLLLNFPNIHILLCHNKQENACDNLVTVKNYFLTTEITRLFPECIPNQKEWGNMSGFSLANRTDWGRTEDNIEAAGVDTEIVGRHYQVAKKNDLVTEKSVGTKEQIEKTLAWDYRFNLGMFDEPTKKIQDYEGTRYHYSDLYALRKNDPKIKLFEVPLLLDGDPDNLNRENIHNPARFSPEDIEELKRDMWAFMCQMMMKPEDPAKAQFTREMIVYFNSVLRGCHNYLLVDPASRRKKKSDYTVMLVVSVDHKGNRYIVDGVRDKLDPKKRIDLALELASKWSIKVCGWESVGFQETDCYYLEEQRRLKRMFFMIEEIQSIKIAKEDRIRSLVPEYAQHRWLWPKKGSVVKRSLFDGRSYDLTEEMEYELLQFPLSEHDDLLDTMTFINKINVILPKVVDETPKDEGMTFGEYVRLHEERKRWALKDPWRGLSFG